jgi:hypothetical protein
MHFTSWHLGVLVPPRLSINLAASASLSPGSFVVKTNPLQYTVPLGLGLVTQGRPACSLAAGWRARALLWPDGDCQPLCIKMTGAGSEAVDYGRSASC